MISFHKGFMVGMVHLLPLPGANGYKGSFQEVIDRALADSIVLNSTGFDAILVQNHGDSPFHAKVDQSTISHMAIVCHEIRQVVKIPIGVSLLRNDGPGSVAVTAASGGEFVRIKTHVGLTVWPEGIMKGEATETLQTINKLNVDLKIMADISAHHARNLYVQDPHELALANIDFGKADVLIVSEKNIKDSIEYGLGLKKNPVSAKVFLGSGANHENIEEVFRVFDGVIVGGGIKKDRCRNHQVDHELCARLIQQVRNIRWEKSNSRSKLA